MIGKFPVRFPRMDETGPDIRYSPGFDAAWLAQCINPSSSGALQQLFDALKADEVSGIMTKCSATDNISLDETGNIKLCSDEADSYIGISGGNWTWDYYCALDNSCLPAGGANPGDSTVTAPNPTSAGADALPGEDPSVTFDPAKRLWLVVAEDGGKIKGQLMTEKNKTSGSVLSIGGSSAHTPKVAYGPNLNKYLVVWTAGEKTSSVLDGQILNEDGSASGGVIKIDSGGPVLYADSNLIYDAGHRRFVLAYEKAGNRVNVMTVAINGTGAITGPAALATGIHNLGSSPSIALNTSTGDSCATYLNGDVLKIQPISPDTVPGTATDLATTLQNIGIVYIGGNLPYLAAWQENGEIKQEALASCAGEPDSSPGSLASGIQTGVLVPSTSGFGLFVIDEGGTSDRFFAFDNSGNSVGDGEQTVFSGTWDEQGFWPSAGANSVAGTFAAVASPDRKTVKFAAGLGSTNDLAANVSAAKPNNLPVPNQGLPTDFGQLVEAIFNWSLAIIGLVIFVRFFYAGVKWAFLSHGSSIEISEAQTIMKNAAYGAVILFSAYLILNTINPDLVHSTFNLPGLPASGPASTTSNTTNNTNTTPTHLCGRPNYTCANDPNKGCLYESDCGGVDPVGDSGPQTEYNCSDTATCVAAPGGVGTYPDLSTCQQNCESSN